MKSLPLERDTILKRVNGIQQEIAELVRLSALPRKEFTEGEGHKLAEYHLHRALEGVFNIGSHILSRIPGGTATQYREIAEKLGEFGIVPTDFAKGKLTLMAKYRNRLVHFYAEITPDELYEILQKDLADFGLFLSAIKQVLQEPARYRLEVK